MGTQALSYVDPSDPGYRNATHNLEVLVFQLGTSVARELAHLFAGFVTGIPDLAGTPRRGFDADGALGEAGRSWASRLFGGHVDFLHDWEDPLGAAQAGVPLLCFAGRRGEARYVRVDQAYVRLFLQLLLRG